MKMLLLYTMFFMLFLLTMLLSMISFFFSKKSMNKREKLTPFECGFDFNSESRSPFSLKFFMISIIFIIFDVEIALMLPLMFTTYKSNLFFWVKTSMIFVFILILGTLMEWKEMSFEWVL